MYQSCHLIVYSKNIWMQLSPSNYLYICVTAIHVYLPSCCTNLTIHFSSENFLFLSLKC